MSLLGSPAMAQDQHVTNTASSGAGSLPEAVSSVTAGANVIFDSAVAGQTISLSGLTVTRSMHLVNANDNVTIDLGTDTLLVSTADTVSLGDNLTITTAGTSDVKAYVIYGTAASSLNLSSVAATLNATGVISHGIYSDYDLDINLFSGRLTVEGDDEATALWAPYGSMSFAGEFTGSVSASATAGKSQAINAADSISFADGFNGTLSSTSQESNAYGIRAVSGVISITDGLNGSISVNAYQTAVGLQAGGAITISGGLGGTINSTAPATNGFAYGFRGDGAISGGSGTPLLVTGTVSASADYAYAVFSFDNINLTVADGATVSAVSTSGTGNHYAIGTTGTNNSHIELVAGCTLVGDIFLGGAADTLTLSGANGSTTLGGNITNVETISITGGHWNLDGAISGCNVFDIAGGAVALNGSVSNVSMTVDEDGLLGGNGSLLNLTNYGTVSPGNSIGTLTVTGDYTNAAGSTVEIEINDTGDCDQIDVGGTATLSGGRVSVLAESGTYRDGDTYTFLTADGGVTGTFDSVIDDLAFFDVSLVYGIDSVGFLLTAAGNYVDEAHTLNQYGVASYLDARKAGATGDFAEVLAQLNTLDSEGAQAAFVAMNGEIYGSLSTVSLENSERFLRSLAYRLRVQSMTHSIDFSTADAKDGSLVFVSCEPSCYDPCANRLSGWTTWFDGYGVGASIAGNGNASGLNYSTGGYSLGMERYLDEYTLFGFAGDYSSSRTTLDRRSDWGAIDGGQLSVYLHRAMNCHYLTGILAYGYNRYDARRSIEFGSIDRTARADYSGSNYSAYFEAGRNLYGDFANLQPFAALEYIGVQRNGFAESSADSLDLSVNGETTNAMRGLLGMRLLNYYQTRSGRLVTLDASAAWRHGFLNENRIIDASFAGQTGGTFAVSGINVNRDAAILGAGLNYALSDHCAVYATYDLVFSKDYAAHAGLGGLQYAW